MPIAPYESRSRELPRVCALLGHATGARRAPSPMMGLWPTGWPFAAAWPAASARATTLLVVSTQRANPGDEKHHELPVEELFRRAQPLPPPEEMAIDDLSDEEGAAFLAAIRS